MLDISMTPCLAGIEVVFIVLSETYTSMLDTRTIELNAMKINQLQLDTPLIYTAALSRWAARQTCASILTPTVSWMIH
jgi:hypothetical protein